MKRNYIKFAFILIVIYTLIVLHQYAYQGNYCYQRSVYFLLPIILLIAVVQFRILHKMMIPRNKSSMANKLFSFAGFLFGTFLTFRLASSNLLEGIFYFFPFLLLNTFVMILTFKRKLVSATHT